MTMGAAGMPSVSLGPGRLQNPFSVADVLASGLLGESRVLAGASGLCRTVRSISVLSAPDPGTFIRGGELILTNAYAFREDPGSLSSIVTMLGQGKSAALGIQLGRFIESLPAPVTRAADEAGFPLLSIAGDLAWSDVITSFHALLQRRETELRVDLMNACLTENPGRPLAALAAMVRCLSREMDAKVAVLGRDAAPVALVPAGDVTFVALAREEIGRLRRQTHLCVTRLDGPDGALGHLVCLVRSPEREEDQVYATLTFAAQLAANQMFLMRTRQDLRASRSRMLGEALAREDAVISPAVLGIDGSAALRAVAIAAPGLRSGATLAQDELFLEDAEDALAGPVALVNGVLLGASAIPDLDRATARLKRLAERHPETPTACGVSSPVPAPQLATAIRQALMCLSVSKTIPTHTPSLVCHEKLGLGALLIREASIEDMDTLVNDTVSRVEACGPGWEDLLNSLEVYLAEDGSIANSARILHIHPSTLKYRLQKLRSVLPLKTFDDKVRAYTALRLRRLRDTDLQ